MRAGWENSVAAQGDSWRGTGGKGQQWRPSHGLEHPGLGTLSHRAGTRRRQGGADRGDVTRGKHSGHKHGDHRAEAGAGTKRRKRTRGAWPGVRGRGRRTVQTSTRRTTAWQRPQYAGEVDGAGEPRCTKSTTHVGAREQWG